VTAEVWRPVPGFPNYEVSDHEHARSLPHWDSNNHWHPGTDLNPWLDENGYLHLTLYRDSEVKKPYFHQVVAWAFLPPQPEGTEVCHGEGGKLDNTPGNLSWGTHWKNASPDKFRDGSFLTGDAHQNSKLTMAIVGECRRRALAGGRHDALAAEFGVDQSTMTSAICGKTWRDCPVPPVTGRRTGERHQDAKLTPAIILECRARNAAGETLQDLAREFGVARPTLYYAVIGKTWKHLAGKKKCQ
jgi:hypothetical protein